MWARAIKITNVRFSVLYQYHRIQMNPASPNDQAKRKFIAKILNNGLTTLRTNGIAWKAPYGQMFVIYQLPSGQHSLRT